MLNLSVNTALVNRNHSVTMVLPMVERLRNWPLKSSNDSQTKPSFLTTVEI